MSNKLTLLVDCNWLLISRFSVLSKGFSMENAEIVREQSSEELKELLARSISVALNRFPIIDNIVMVADGGSWRKQLQVPTQLGDLTYKGNRSQDEKMDWKYIYGALNKVLNEARNQGITVSQFNQIEGDDWIWYWSRRLNAEGNNCLIWSSDNDLKQLIQIDGTTNAFTAWYNDKNGLWLHDSLKEEDDPINFFMKLEYFSPVLDNLRARVGDVHYIDPNTIITSKIICGDAGDNIMPIVRYTKNGRNYRITEKDWNKISGDYKYSTIQDILERYDEIARVIVNSTKFRNLINEGSLACDKEQIEEMIQYNIKLVWLHESVIPDTIIQLMNQQEYKQFEVPYLRSNYKILVGGDTDIQSLFDGI